MANGITAEVTLVEGLTYHIDNRTWEKNKPQTLTNLNEIEKYRHNAHFKVVMKGVPKPPQRAAKPAPLPVEEVEEEEVPTEEEAPTEEVAEEAAPEGEEPAAEETEEQPEGEEAAPEGEEPAPAVPAPAKPAAKKPAAKKPHLFQKKGAAK